MEKWNNAVVFETENKVRGIVRSIHILIHAASNTRSEGEYAGERPSRTRGRRVHSFAWIQLRIIFFLTPTRANFPTDTIVSWPVVTGSNQSERFSHRWISSRLLFSSPGTSSLDLRAHRTFLFTHPREEASRNAGRERRSEKSAIETKRSPDPIPRGQDSRRGPRYLGMQVTPFVSPQITPDALSDQITREFMLSRGGYRITLPRVITSIHLGEGKGGRGGRGWTDMLRRRR